MRVFRQGLQAFSILPAVSAGWILAATAGGQVFPVSTVTIPAADVQIGGPAYNYEVGVFEVSNQQFVAFLNDAEFHNDAQNPGFGTERGANMAFRPPPLLGDVGLIAGDPSDADALFDISRSLLVYNSAQPVGLRYSVVSGKADHPIVGVGWFGAVKFCNWLTIDHDLV